MKYITRAEWGARQPARAYAAVSWGGRPGVETHHSVGLYGASTPQAWMRSIQSDHLGRGWTDVFYNVGIWTDGRIVEGRPFTARSGEIHSLTVCFAGNYNERKLTDAQKRAWHDIRAFARGKGAGPAVSWHGQRAAVACPGNDVIAWLRAGFDDPGDDMLIEEMTPQMQRRLVRLAEAAHKASGRNTYEGTGTALGQAGKFTDEVIIGSNAPGPVWAGRRVGQATFRVEAELDDLIDLLGQLAQSVKDLARAPGDSGPHQHVEYELKGHEHDLEGRAVSRDS